MTWTQAIQSSLELWGALFCAISGVVIRAVYRNKLEIQIANMEFIVSILLLMDALAWIFRGDTSPLGYYMVRISNFSVFALNYAAMMEFGKYVVSRVDESSSEFPVNTWIWAIYMIGLTGIVLVIVNVFTGTYYDFDVYNRYFRTENYYVLMLVAFVGIALNVTFLLMNARYFSGKWLWSLLSYQILPIVVGGIQLFHYGISLINISMALAMLFIFFTWLLEQSERQIWQEKTLIEQEKKMSELQQELMLSQIQPHFLYNSLSAIAQTCEKDPKKAKKATISFADYLRGNMDALKSKEPVPFSKELEHIENYLYLEQVRFGNQLEILYDIETVDFCVPVLSIQPIVENAVKHGIKRNGTVLITAREQSEGYEVQVIDDGVGFDPEHRTEDTSKSHIGIENVRNRLQSMCGGTLAYAETPGGGTTATIFLPKEKK